MKTKRQTLKTFCALFGVPTFGIALSKKAETPATIGTFSEVFDTLASKMFIPQSDRVCFYHGAATLIDPKSNTPVELTFKVDNQTSRPEVYVSYFEMSGISYGLIGRFDARDYPTLPFKNWNCITISSPPPSKVTTPILQTVR